MFTPAITIKKRPKTFKILQGSFWDAISVPYEDRPNCKAGVAQSTTVAELTDYYPYGSTRLDEQSGSFNEQRKFTGQEYDAGTGLYYMNARYQNPNNGNFISQDPSARDNPENFLADPQQLNYYSYGRDNPIRNTDPTGLFNLASPFSYAGGFATGFGLSTGGNISSFVSSLNPFHAETAYAPANETDTVQPAQLSEGTSNTDRSNGLTEGLSFGDKLSQLAGVLGLLVAPETGEEDALSTLSSTANEANSGLSADSAYSKAGEHVATLHPGRYPGMSASDISGIAQDTRTNADVSARIKGTDPSTGGPVNKQYYGNSNTGQVFVNTNIGSPTVFPNSNPSGYISRQISRDLTNYGSR